MSAIAYLAEHASEAEVRSAIVAEAHLWLRTPYHHRGRVRGVGVDCAMLLAEVYERVGLVPRIEAEYVPDWHMHRDRERYLEFLERYADEVAVPAPGDAAVWRFGRTFSHGAIVIDGRQVIHAHRGRPVEIASMEETYLASRPVRFFSLWSRHGW